MKTKTQNLRKTKKKKIQENEEKNEIREEIKIIQESEPQEEIIKDDDKNK